MRKIVFPLVGLMLLTILIILVSIPQAPLLSSKSQTSDAEVWFGPNMASTDEQLLFTNPEFWLTARATIDVFQFYSPQLSQYPCPRCGINTYQNLANLEVFRHLKSANKKIAVEHTIITPELCNVVNNNPSGSTLAQIGLQESGTAIYNVGNSVYPPYSLGSTPVDYFAMDEPLTHGWKSSIVQGQSMSCGFNLQQSAQITADYVNLMRQTYPNIKIGLIEAYPNPEKIAQGNAQVSAQYLIQFIKSLENRGAYLDFLHIDWNREASTVHGTNVQSDLNKFKSFAAGRSYQMDFGVIINANTYNGYVSTNNAGYSQIALQSANIISSTIGITDDFIVQSFHDYNGPAPSSYSGPATIPSNLDESTPLTHTWLLNEAWRQSGGQPPDILPPSAVPSLNIQLDPNFDPPSYIDLSWGPATDNTGVHKYILDISLGDSSFQNPSLLSGWSNRDVGNILNFHIPFPPVPFGNQGSVYPGTYYVRIKAIDASGNEGPYLVQQVTVNPPIIFAPTNLIAAVISPVIYSGTPATVQLSWTDNSNNEHVFEVDYSTDPNFNQFSQPISLGAVPNTNNINYQVYPSYLSPSPIPIEGPYYFRVRAKRFSSSPMIPSPHISNFPANDHYSSYSNTASVPTIFPETN